MPLTALAVMFLLGPNFHTVTWYWSQLQLPLIKQLVQVRTSLLTLGEISRSVNCQFTVQG
jgi:hypothetical protein